MSRKKSDYDYAYAVARVRANEKSLLSAADMEQLIEAEDYDTAMKKLSDMGWGDPDQVADYAEFLENYFAKTTDLLTEVLGEDGIHIMDMLIIPNDVQNLKAALKAKVSQNDAKDLYTQSTVYPAEKVIEAVQNKAFEDLPEFMQEPAAEAYDVLTSNGNGQVADAIIDSAALAEMVKLGAESGSKVLEQLAERKVAAADMKVALRCAHTHKSADFIQKSIVPCATLDAEALKEAAKKNVDEVLDYISTTTYKVGAEKFKESTSAFEKWCDDILMECVNQAKFTALGVDPLVAYYIARDAEIKSVRILLSAKKNHLSNDIIRERVRTLYV